MRLSAEYVAAIKQAAREAFGADAVVRLFGSRTDDSARGGDIDLLIEVSPGAIGIVRESRFLSTLFERIDEQKVDLVLVERGKPLPPFAALVHPKSVVLQ